MKRRLLVVGIFFSLFILSGCMPSKANIVVTNYVNEYLVSRIGGEYVDVVNLSTDGLIQTQNIKEDYSDILDEGDMLIYINDLVPYWDIYYNDISDSDIKLVDLSLNSSIYKFNRVSTAYVNNKQVIVEMDYYDGDEFNNIDMYGNDPYAWMDPIVTMAMAKSIRDQLVKAYPEYARAFNDNYTELEAELARLDAEYQAINNSRYDIKFVSMSSSFGYLQKSYGLEVYPVVLSKFGALPSEEQYNIIVSRIKKDNVKYIIAEHNLTDEMKVMYNRIIKDCNLTPITLDNLNSINESDLEANYDYITLMYRNLEQLALMNSAP